MVCLFGHKWNGCTCDKCGKVRDQDHPFVRTPGQCVEVCARCGKTQALPHTYVPVTGRCQERCEVCGNVHAVHHQVQGGACQVCGTSVAGIEAEYESGIASVAPGSPNATIWAAIETLATTYSGLGDPARLDGLCHAYADTMVAAIEDYWAVTRGKTFFSSVRRDPVERFLAVRSGDSRYYRFAETDLPPITPGMINPKSATYGDMLYYFCSKETALAYQSLPPIAFVGQGRDNDLLEVIASNDREATRQHLYTVAVAWVQDQMSGVAA